MEASRRRRVLGRAAWLALIALGGGGFAYQRSHRPVPVAVDSAALGRAVDAIYATGSVEAENRVLVKARSPGALVSLLVRAGAAVKRGDLLARIDSPVATFDVARGRAELHAAVEQSGKDAPRLEALSAQARSLESDLAVAEHDLARTLALADAGALAANELERAPRRRPR